VAVSELTSHWFLRKLGPFNPARERHLFWGIAGVLLLFVSLCAMHLFGVPPFAPLDEPRHVAYAIEVAEGKLPDVRDKVQLRKLHVRRIKGTNMMAAAAHPPLYYVLVGLPLKWSSQGGDLTWGTWVSRGVTLLLGAAGLVYAYLAAALLAKGRSVALLAIAFCALMPAFVNVCSLVHNDSLAFLTTSALFHAVLLVLLRGPSRRALTLVVVWGALAAATRFASLVAVAPALTAVGLHLLFAQEKPWRARLRDAALFSAAALALIAVSSGWFYLRSYRLYGDLTAGKALFEGLNRPLRTPFIESVLTPSLWAKLISDLWGRLAAGVTLGKSVTTSGTAFVLVGMTLALGRWLWSLRRSTRATFLGARAGALAFVVVTSLCVILPIFEFYSRGGNLTARYYFPVLWVPLLAVAVGYSVPGRLAGAAALLFSGGLGLWCTELYLDKLMRGRQAFAVAHAFEAAGLPAPRLLAWLLVASTVAGILMVVWGWLGLRAAERTGSLNEAGPSADAAGTSATA
jgi:hypothetical protein